MTCEDIQDYAFETHTYCYNTPPQGYASFCELAFTDWLQTSWNVKQSIFRETLKTLKQIFQILGHCAFIGLFGE